MEKFMQRESVFLEAQSSGETDFNDVFGGPPRRFSMQEVRVRYSFADQMAELEEVKAESSSPWSTLKEKPVFGEENGPRRRHQGDDFFDDIFRGSNESHGSPRRVDSVMGSSPGSRIMSPAAKPLPPSAEPFGTSFPPQLSLPAKLTKAIDIPIFGSNNHGQYKTDGTTNALISPHSSTSLSRFSIQAIKGQDKMRNEVHHESPLSHQDSFSSQDSPLALTSDQKEDVVDDNMEKDNRRNSNSFGNHFHFSIYKWAGRGVPMLMPLMAGNNLKSKGKSDYERSASSHGRMETKKSTVIKQEVLATEPKPSKKERENEDLSSKKEHQSSIQEASYEILESKPRRSSNDNIGYDGGRKNTNEKIKSLDGNGIGEKLENKVPLKTEESLIYEVKPLRALLNDAVEQENITKTKESKTTTPKGVHANAHDRKKNVKENEGRRIESNNVKVKKSSFHDAPGLTSGKNVAKGKVKDFVQIFNHDADSRPKAGFRRRSQSSRWNKLGHDQNENEVSPNATKAREKVNLHNNADKKPDVSLKVDEIQNKDETRERTSNLFSTNLKKSFSSDTLHTDSNISVENIDYPLEDNFLVQELSDDHEKVTQDESSDDTKAIDAKIKQWSNGKKGNIRSLLSTLQYVLWAESGWKAVPLVDLIEANSVKRAYQKALLRLHPDKLQQKGAAFHHKYIAEKVFDILQEAWDHFNTCSSLNM